MHPKSYRNREAWKLKEDKRNIFESKKKWDDANKEVVLPNMTQWKLKDIKRAIAHMELREFAKRIDKD